MVSPSARTVNAQTPEDALFRTLIATAVDGIIVIDERGTVQVFNKACEKLFRFSPDEVIGQNVKILMPAPFREEHDGYLARYHNTGERRIIGIGREVRGRRKDGSSFPMYLSVGEGMVGGKKIFVGIIHDLTERQTTERRLQDLQSELLHVSRLTAMGQMASALAHELNQPLTAIMNYVKAAQRTMAQDDAEAGARAADLMEKAATQTGRAGDIIRRLRSFVDKKETTRTPENINVVVEESVALSVVSSSDAKLELRLLPQGPPVFVDKVQIQQVIINLVRNALEAMQESSERYLRISTAAPDEGYVEVSVSDTGPGVAPEVLARLFQPFTTTKEKGMGVGLTICQSIVDAHGGRIWVTDNAGAGVTFRFRLPIAPSE